MIRALAITVSNRAAAGVYEDRSGPLLVELLRSAGCDVVDGPLVIPDGDAVEQVLRDSVTAEYDVAITTGGTGLTPTDQTPEMTRRVLDWEIPGIAEALRSAGAAAGVPSAILSRGLAGPHADRQPARLVGRCTRRHERTAADTPARGGPDPRR
jgi:molybdenum cofactor synthesis domain-containing protein